MYLNWVFIRFDFVFVLILVFNCFFIFDVTEHFYDITVSIILLMLLFFVFFEFLSGFSSSFALTEAIVVSQINALISVDACRFVYRSWLQFSDVESAVLWQIPSTRVSCLLYSVLLGMTLILLSSAPTLRLTKSLRATLDKQQRHHTNTDGASSVGAIIVNEFTHVFINEQQQQRLTRRQLQLRATRRQLAALAIQFALIVTAIVGIIVTPITSAIMRTNCWQW